MILVKKTIREELEEARLLYSAVPDKGGNQDRLIAALRTAFADSKSSFAVQEVLNLVMRLSSVEVFKKEINSGSRRRRDLAKEEIGLANSVEELDRYIEFNIPGVAKMLRRRRFQLKSQGKK